MLKINEIQGLESLSEFLDRWEIRLEDEVEFNGTALIDEYRKS